MNINKFDIPIFKKIYDLYKTFYSYRNTVSKQDRYTLWQRCENLILNILENILRASHLPKAKKLPILEKTSIQLNLLRVLLRLCKEVKAIDNKKYVFLQETIDEIVKMLGGWIKSTKE